MRVSVCVCVCEREGGESSLVVWWFGECDVM